MLSSAGVAPLSPGFHKLLSVTVTTFAVFPSWMYLLGADDNCMLSVSSSTCEPRNCCWQAKWRNLPGDSWCRFYVVQFRQMRMISFLPSLAVLPTCYLLHVSRLFGLTLCPSAPVFRCHGFLGRAGGWHLCRKPCVFPPSLSPRFFCSC